MHKSPPDLSKARLWIQISGPLLAASVAAAIELLSQGVLKIPNPPAILLLVVVFSAFIGGLRSGLVTALIAWLYFVYFFSIPGQPFHHTEENLRRVIVWAVTTPVMVIMVGVLKRHAERALEISKENAILTEQITERTRAEQVIRLLNAELEQRVAHRTAQLEAANKELESFAYTVAHDLRAPLITINGFSRVLLEDYASALGDEAQGYLRQVGENVRRMGELIDDLLDFSRLSRQPLNKHEVAAADIVRQALADLDGARAHRHIDIVIGALPACQADPALLKQVFANLLSNALKYTRKREAAAIEIGWRENADEPGYHTYYVKDNGVGFDMRYADKLFRVFQRLHPAEEYEGTGVGLAIVQRIIHRLSGRVWAEAEVDKGATFYFTLERSATV